MKYFWLFVIRMVCSKSENSERGSNLGSTTASRISEDNGDQKNDLVEDILKDRTHKFYKDEDRDKDKDFSFRD